MKGKILITFFVAIFLLALIPYESIVCATSTNYSINFEGSASQQFNNAYLYTINETSTNFWITTSNPHTGTKAFQWSTGARGKMIFKYTNVSTTNVCNNISFWHDTDGGWTIGHTAYIGLFNRSLLGATTIANAFANPHKWLLYSMYQLSDGAGGKFYIADFTGSYIQMAASCFWNTGVATKMSIGVDNDLGDMTYMWGATQYDGTSCNITGFLSGYKIDGIMFSTTASVPTHMVVDDMNITISSSYTGEGGGESLYCGNDVSDYYQIGDIFGTDDSDQVNSPELFEYHNVKRATQIKGVALKVSVDQYTDDSNTANYSLQINGISLGNPDCFSQASNGYDWLLYWSCNVNIQNETTAFVFKHTKANSFGRYWQVCVGNFGQDLDGDADAEYYYSDEFQDCGWQWFGGVIPWWVCSGYTANQIVGKDLAMSFFITNLGTSQTFDYPSSLGLHGWDYKNATGYIYSLGKSIACSYTLGDNAYNYQISLYKNTTQILTSGFPTSVNYPSGSVGYTPFTIGKYKFQLNSTHAIDNVTAYVIGTLPNFYIFTNPVITNQYSYYSVYYKYYHPQGFDGYATMFDILGNFPNYYLNSYSRNIFNNVSSNFTYFSTSSSAEYWTLFANKTNAFNNVGNLHKHFIRLQGISTNTINVVPTSILLSHEQLKNYNFTIYGQHTFVGTDISVFVNNNFIAIVGDSQNYILTYNPPDFGSYIVSLRILQDGLWVTLCNASFIVISSDTPTSEAEKPLLEPPYTYIFGALITVVFIILPVIGIGKLNIQSDIIKYVPIFTGVVGFILSCLIGLFPWYSIFALLFILIMIITVLYLAKNKSG